LSNEFTDEERWPSEMTADKSAIRVDDGSDMNA
jgi:hypothetical protein